MSKLRVLIALYSLGNGGGEKALVNMLNSFPPERYDIELQLFENKGLNLPFLPSFVKLREPLFPNGMLSSSQQIRHALRHFRVDRLAKKAWHLCKARRANSREKTYFAWKSLQPLCPVNNERYDVAISAMHGLSTYYVFDCIQAERKICWVHTDYSKIPRVEQDALYFNRAYRVITVSEHCRAALQEAFPKLDNITVLHNLNCPQLIETMAAQQTAAECYPDEFTHHVLSVGRLIPLKGFDMAIRAAAAMKQQGVSFGWYVLGEGEERRRLEEQAREYGVEDRMHFIGAVSNPYPYMAYADVVVQTSRYEGKSMVLDEAKLLCRPIVSTAYDSVYDQLTDGENGVIVPISEEGIADGVLRVLRDAALRETLVGALRSTDTNQTDLIEQHFSLIEGRDAVCSKA